MNTKDKLDQIVAICLFCRPVDKPPEALSLGNGDNLQQVSHIWIFYQIFLVN